MSQPRILFTVLNWGLGHAARSIPVIKALMKRGCEVMIASDGGALRLLKEALPAQQYFELPAYNVTYPGRSIVANGALNARKILSAIRAEHTAISDIVQKNGVDAILSDNRYGCYGKKIPSVILTHQLTLITRNPLVNWLGRRALDKWLDPFDEIWVPDTGDRLLSGALSDSTDPRVHYIGLLSTIVPLRRKVAYNIAIILSGPEPQRTHLERLIAAQLLLLPRTWKMTVIRGLSAPVDKLLISFAEVVDFTSRFDMADVINSSEIIICRAGYSSLMDLMIAGKRALLVPTPGQPEQAYLAQKAAQMPQFVTQNQKKLNLAEGIKTLSEASIPMPVDNQQHLLGDQIDRLLSRL